MVQEKRDDNLDQNGKDKVGKMLQASDNRTW